MNTFLKSFVLLLCVSISTTAIGEEKKAPKSDAVKADAAKTIKKKKKEEKKEDGKKWDVNARVNLYVGQGTFTSLEGSPLDDRLRDVPGDPSNFADNMSLSFGASAGYKLDPVSLRLSVDARKNLAQIGIDADLLTFGASLGYRLEPISFGLSMKASKKLSEVGIDEDLILRDLYASANWDGYTIEAIDSKVTAGLTLGFPTSFNSQVLNLIIGSSGYVGISKTFFKKLNLSLNVGGTKDFHSNVSPSINPDDLTEQNIIYRSDEIEVLENGDILIGGITREYSLGFTLGAGFPVIEKLRMSASYTLSNSWSYDRDADTDDEFAPSLLDENGNPVADSGRRFGQSTQTSLSLSYPFNWAGFGLTSSIGISTRQLPKTNDNKSFNFPFWNFNGAAKNQSGVNFNLSASY